MYVGLSLQAAMCYIHIAALIAEYLKRKGKINISKIVYLEILLFKIIFGYLAFLPYM